MEYPGNRWRPSPALVVSFIALFIALSGVALALERGSVKGKHIARDAVKSKHVKAGTLNGKHFVHGIESYDFHVERAPNAFGSISVLDRDGFDVSLDCGAGDLLVHADPDPGTELFATWISPSGTSGAGDTGEAPDTAIALNVNSVNAQGTLTALSSDGTITTLEYTGLRGIQSTGVPCRFYGHGRVSNP